VFLTFDVLMVVVVIVAAAAGMWFYSGVVLMALILAVYVTRTSQRALDANLPLALGRGAEEDSPAIPLPPPPGRGADGHPETS